jgi:hypothetical protein
MRKTIAFLSASGILVVAATGCSETKAVDLPVQAQAAPSDEFLVELPGKGESWTCRVNPKAELPPQAQQEGPGATPVPTATVTYVPSPTATPEPSQAPSASPEG